MKVAIVEDEVQSQEILKRCLDKYARAHNIIMESVVFKSGLDLVSEYAADYDVIFMDIMMSFMDGIETAKVLRKLDERVPLIFVTNMPKFAIKGYEVAALDYCLKPLQYYVFLMKMKRALQCVERNEDKHIIINTGNGKKRVSVNSIEFVEITNHSLRWHIAGGEVTFGQSGEIFRTNIILARRLFVTYFSLL